MTVDELIALRKTLGLTQAQMASAIGLGARAYSAIETGEAVLRKIHTLAAERVAISMAAEDEQIALKLPANLRADSVRIATIVTGLR